MKGRPIAALFGLLHKLVICYPTQRPATCAIAGTVTGLNSGSQPSMIRRLPGFSGLLMVSRAVSEGAFLTTVLSRAASRSPFALRLT
jgi:hypothetical protein